MESLEHLKATRSPSASMRANASVSVTSPWRQSTASRLGMCRLPKALKRTSSAAPAAAATAWRPRMANWASIKAFGA